MEMNNANNARSVAFTSPAPFPARARGRGRRSTSSRRPPVSAVKLTPGDELSGVVNSIKSFGVFVSLEAGNLTGLIHISELTHGFVSDVSDVVSVGDNVRVRVLSHDEKTGRIALSMKQSYERSIAIGDDWGHPWGDDPNNPTKWADLGKRPPPRQQHWEVDPERRAPLAGHEDGDSPRVE